jgi:transcriptional regulator with XRE-family HTH domain
VIDAVTVRALIRTKVAQHKNTKQAADALGIDPNHLRKILRGAMPPGLKLLKLVGVRRVIGYEVI